MTLIQLQNDAEDNLIPVGLSPFLDYMFEGEIRSFDYIMARGEEERNEAGFFTVVEPQPDPFGRTPVSSTFEERDGQWHRVPTYPEIDLEAAKLGMLERVAEVRKERSRQLSFAGLQVDLTKDTEDAINKAIAALERKPEGAVVKWEVRRGFTTPLDLPWLYALGDAAFDRVQACFDNVDRLTLEIMACTSVEDLLAIDINSGWPE